VHADALLSVDPRRIRVPPSAASTTLFVANRGLAFSSSYLEMARHLLRDSEAGASPATQWREATEAALLAALRRRTRNTDRDWGQLHPQLVLVASPDDSLEYGEDDAPLVVRVEGKVLWIDAAVECLESRYPGARLLLLAAIDRVEPLVDLFGPWRMFDEAEHGLWFGEGTTKDFVSHLVVECDVEVEPGESVRDIARRNGWYTPSDYAEDVPADLLPPGCVKTLLQEIGPHVATDAARPRWSQDEAGLSGHAERLARRAKRRGDPAAQSIFEAIVAVFATQLKRCWEWGGSPLKKHLASG
jgi:hypothetical protein